MELCMLLLPIYCFYMLTTIQGFLRLSQVCLKHQVFGYINQCMNFLQILCKSLSNLCYLFMSNSCYLFHLFFCFVMKVKLSAKWRFAFFEMSLFCISSEVNKNKLNDQRKVWAITLIPHPQSFLHYPLPVKLWHHGNGGLHCTWLHSIKKGPNLIC